MVWLLRLAGLGWAMVALSVVCPAEWLSLIYGQYGGIIGCLVFAGLVLASRRPVAAGIMIGLVTLKPQTGLLAPVVWLGARRWRAIAVACITFGVLAAVPVLLFGSISWELFLRYSGGMAANLVQAKFGQGYQLTGTSVFWMLRSFGAGIFVAYMGQGIAALTAALAVYRLWRMDIDKFVQSSLTMFLALFVAPYGFSVDMVGYSVGLAVLAERRGWRVSLIDGLLWLWPGYVAIVTQLTGVLLTPLVVVGAVFMGWRQLRMCRVSGI
jgi:alpha-1,2-mannosyltransferase